MYDTFPSEEPMDLLLSNERMGAYTFVISNVFPLMNSLYNGKHNFFNTVVFALSFKVLS